MRGTQQHKESNLKSHSTSFMYFTPPPATPINTINNRRYWYHRCNPSADEYVPNRILQYQATTIVELMRNPSINKLQEYHPFDEHIPSFVVRRSTPFCLLDDSGQQRTLPNIMSYKYRPPCPDFDPPPKFRSKT